MMVAFINVRMTDRIILPFVAGNGFDTTELFHLLLFFYCGSLCGSVLEILFTAEEQILFYLVLFCKGSLRTNIVSVDIGESFG
jgi:hypothetical protein